LEKIENKNQQQLRKNTDGMAGIVHGWLLTGRAGDTYPRALAQLHWGMAAGLAANMALAQGAQLCGSKHPRARSVLMQAHESVGVLLLAAAGSRVVLRLTSPLPVPADGPLLAQVAAQLAHWSLYGAMFVLPASGLAMAWFSGRGLSFFGLRILRGRAPSPKRAAKAIQLHKRAGKWLTWLLAAHVGAVVFHYATRGHLLVERILP
jgi:cytochrome b561